MAEPTNHDTLLDFEREHLFEPYRGFYLTKRFNFFTTIQNFGYIWDCFMQLDQILDRAFQQLQQLRGPQHREVAEVRMVRIWAVLLFLGISACSTFAAQDVKKKPNIKRVNLEAILSCQEEPIFKAAFETDWRTALNLNGIQMIMDAKTKSDDMDYINRRSKNFVTDLQSDSFVIMPTDWRGVPIDSDRLPFCMNYTLALYEDVSKYKSLPYAITVAAEDYAFDSNEVFMHAEQFTFKSGVFSNSSDAYFTATKGRVSLQFKCTPKGLKLYRVFYDRE